MLKNAIILSIVVATPPLVSILDRLLTPMFLEEGLPVSNDVLCKFREYPISEAIDVSNLRLGDDFRSLSENVKLYEVWNNYDFNRVVARNFGLEPGKIGYCISSINPTTMRHVSFTNEETIRSYMEERWSRWVKYPRYKNSVTKRNKQLFI